MTARHGTYTRYSGKPGCRCKKCRVAKAAYMVALRRRGLDAGDERHGTRNGYDNFGCRCEACKAAKSASAKDYWQREEAA